MMEGHTFNQRTYDRFKKIFQGINVFLPDDPSDLQLELLLTGIRAKIHVSQIVDDSDPHYVVSKNVVLELAPPVTPPQYNVFTDHNDSHVFRGAQYGKAKLPIKPKEI